MRKTIVAMGLLLLIAGFVALLFPAEEPYQETLQIDEWSVASRILAPFARTPAYGRLMKPDWYFQLDLSSNDTVQLIVSISSSVTLEKVPIFIRTGTNFNQQVVTPNTGTYWIDIENETPSPVSLDGNVIANQVETTYRNLYPYALPGYFIVVAGAGILIFGIFKKPKRLSKPKTKKSKP